MIIYDLEWKLLYFFIWLILEAGQKSWKYFVAFWENFKTPQSCSEIIWPLRQDLTRLRGLIEKFGFKELSFQWVKKSIQILKHCSLIGSISKLVGLPCIASHRYKLDWLILCSRVISQANFLAVVIVHLDICSEN